MKLTIAKTCSLVAALSLFGSTAALAQEEVPPTAQPAGAPVENTSGSGQWVYTGQYGWVWMPYGDQYSSAPEGTTDPYAYVYNPSSGWGWLAAPWLLGWGPIPYFGALGPYRFGWYGGPGFFRGGYGFGYRGGFGGGFRGGFGGGFRGGFGHPMGRAVGGGFHGGGFHGGSGFHGGGGHGGGGHGGGHR
jgi:hypothetical protein